MSLSLDQARREFLVDVADRVPPRFHGVAFDDIVDRLIQWSRASRIPLDPREPGDQCTVSFGLRESDVVVWSAYPRNEDGAKVVVLPRTFRRLTDKEQAELVKHTAIVAPGVKLSGSSLLQVGMHLLATDRSLGQFLRLLDRAALLGSRHAAR